MRVYFNNNLFRINDLDQLVEVNSSYSGLVEFVKNWLSGQQYFNFQTSGSTGVPKNILISKNQIEASVSATKEALGLNKNDTVLICLNPEYIATLMMVARCLILEMDMYIISPSSNPLKDLNQNLKIDFASFVPIQIDTILKSKEADKLQNIRNILIGGAALSDGLMNQLSQINTNIYQTYGMTETVSHIALMKLQNEQFFTALKGIEIKKDTTECLAIKGEVTGNKWLQTNDIVELIDSNKFRWLGRADNVINSGGIKVFSEQLESIAKEVFNKHHFKSGFFFYGEKDNKLGEKICLIFEKKAPSEAVLTSLNNSIIRRFSKYHIPKKISAKNEFSRTNSGKIKRLETIKLLE